MSVPILPTRERLSDVRHEIRGGLAGTAPRPPRSTVA
jgi:hypothetical protein